MSAIRTFVARKIITMDPNRPDATHVAVRDGRILAVGGKDDIADWGDQHLDERYADKVILPGFVEGHAHIMAGSIWRYLYVGFQDRGAPDGTAWQGLTTIEAVLDRLKQADAALTDPQAPLIAWGFDPIFLSTRRLDRHHLDQVSADRPIAVLHSNFHLLTANSSALALAEYGPGTNVIGVALDDAGQPNGELQEMAAMFPVLRRLGVDFAALSGDADGIRAYGEVARRCGVTTVTDLFSELNEQSVARLLDITAAADFPVRLVPALNALIAPAAEIAERSLALAERSSEKLRLGAVKLMTDGSIQGFTAQVRPPGYYKGPDHAIWNIAPEQLHATVELLHARGLQMHIHVNGDLASEVALDALEQALMRHPRGDHRHTLQHCQMADRAQFRRMAALGVCVNLFANHIFYFGDQHYETTLGPDRALRMNACASALEYGVPLAIHSDAPVTPMGPLFTAACAVQRRTASGRVLGARQRISVEQALQAITLGAAYTLKLDAEVGSIECGKRADFAVLDEDPLSVGAEGLQDIAVAATVLLGEPTGGD